MTDVTDPTLFDTTAANNLAARGNSVAEGWLPSVVNNWGRAFMSLIAALYDYISGQNTVGGTANAITITNTVALGALGEGVYMVFQNSSGPNTAAVTLNVDGLGAKAIRLFGDNALVGGELLDDGLYIVRYDASANAAAGAWIVLNPSPISNTYTPTATNTTNIDSSTPGVCGYSRNGNDVIVSGPITVDTAAGAGTSSLLGISLPIASNFGASSDAAGVFYTDSLAEGGIIFADSANDRLSFRWLSQSTGSRSIYFVVRYRVI